MFTCSAAMTSSPLLSNSGWGLTRMAAYRSPGPPPPTPASPSPESLICVPVSIPAGTEMAILRLRVSVPAPRNRRRGRSTTLPSPPHLPQVETCMNWPKMPWVARRTSPVPPQFRHVTGLLLGSLRVPMHLPHTSVRVMSRSISTPKAASSKSRTRVMRRSAPRLAVDRVRAPPPKNASNMSPKPPKSAKPSKPAPPFMFTPAWPSRSYLARFSESVSTWYASFTSLKRSVASGLLFRSGWYSSASFLNAFRTSSSEAVRGRPRTS